MSQEPSIPIASGQVRLSNAGIEFLVIKVQNNRAYCRSLNVTGDWNADKNYLESRSKFLRNWE